MTIIRIILLATLAIVSFLPIDQTRAHSQQPQRIKSESDWILVRDTGISFWIARNLVICKNVPSQRMMFVFMEPQSFSVANLTKSFRHLSNKNIHPGSLTIFVRTDRVILQKWVDLYERFSVVSYDGRRLLPTDGLEDQLYEETKIGSYQAEYFRSYGSEYFSYSPDTQTGKRLTERLSDSPLEYINTGDRNADLVAAAWKGCIDCMNNLLEQGADINWENKYGMTSLVAAVIMRRTEIIKILLDRGANINATDSDGWTPLLYATSNALSESLAIELIRRGADVNAQTQCGDTALTLAIQMGVEKVQVVEELLNKGADFTVKDRQGRTLLQIAETHHHDNIIRLLRKKEVIK